MANENETIITLENLIRFKQDFEQHIGAQFAPAIQELIAGQEELAAFVYKEFTGDSQEEISAIYHARPLCLGLPNDNDHIYFFKTDVTGDVLRYQTVYELDGQNMIVYITITYDQENDTYEVNEGMIPLSGGSSESDLTIMTNPADMANIVHAYATGDSTGFKENHKYGLSGDAFVDFFTDSLNSEDLYWLMRGRSYENRLIMFNGEKLKLDKSVTNTYRLHNSDDSVQITLVRAEEDTVTVNISDQFAYLEIIFFHYEGE